MEASISTQALPSMVEFVFLSSNQQCEKIVALCDLFSHLGGNFSNQFFNIRVKKRIEETQFLKTTYNSISFDFPNPTNSFGYSVSRRDHREDITGTIYDVTQTTSPAAFPEAQAH